jgi:hypothetical protein
MVLCRLYPRTNEDQQASAQKETGRDGTGASQLTAARITPLPTNHHNRRAGRARRRRVGFGNRSSTIGIVEYGTSVVAGSSKHGLTAWILVMKTLLAETSLLERSVPDSKPGRWWKLVHRSPRARCG